MMVMVVMMVVVNLEKFERWKVFCSIIYLKCYRMCPNDSGILISLAGVDSNDNGNGNKANNCDFMASVGIVYVDVVG